jgi:hypothetical protein
VAPDSTINSAPWTSNFRWSTGSTWRKHVKLSRGALHGLDIFEVNRVLDKHAVPCPSGVMKLNGVTILFGEDRRFHSGRWVQIVSLPPQVIWHAWKMHPPQML